MISVKSNLILLCEFVSITSIPCCLLLLLLLVGWSRVMQGSHCVMCSHCVMFNAFTYCHSTDWKHLQPINRILYSINTKPPWQHTTNGNTQKIHFHTIHMLKSGSTRSLDSHYPPKRGLVFIIVRKVLKISHSSYLLIFKMM